LSFSTEGGRGRKRESGNSPIGLRSGGESEERGRGGKKRVGEIKGETRRCAHGPARGSGQNRESQDGRKGMKKLNTSVASGEGKRKMTRQRPTERDPTGLILKSLKVLHTSRLQKGEDKKEQTGSEEGVGILRGVSPISGTI